MKNLIFVRAAAALGFASLASIALAADFPKPVQAFASRPFHCSQLQGGEQHAGDAVDAGYSASLSAALSAAMSGNSRDVEAALRTVASACQADREIVQASSEPSASK